MSSSQKNLRYGQLLLSWRLAVSPSAIYLRWVRDAVHAGLLWGGVLLGGLGIVALVAYLGSATNWLREPVVLNIWSYAHPLLRLFWVGVVGFLYALYRVRFDAQRRRRFRVQAAGDLEDTKSAWLDQKTAASTQGYRRIAVEKAYAPAAVLAVEKASLAAVRRRHIVGTRELFLALCNDYQVAMVLRRLGIFDNSGLQTTVRAWQGVTNDIADDEPGHFSDSMDQVLLFAYVEASGLGNKKVYTPELLLGCVRFDKRLTELLYDRGIDLQKLYNVVRWFSVSRQLYEQWREERRLALFKPTSHMDRAYTATATPLLGRMGRDLTRAARAARLDYCVGRNAELDELFTALEAGHAGVAIVGPEGVGKTTMLYGLAYRMAQERVPDMLTDKRLVEIDVARVVGSGAASEAEGLLVALLDEVKRAGNIILAVRNVDNIIGVSAGGEQSLDVSEVLADAIERKEIICIATVEESNWQQYMEGTAIGNALFHIALEEPHDNALVQMIASKVGGIEGRHHAYLTYDAWQSAIELSAQYLHEKALPAKAIDVLEEAASAKGPSSKGGARRRANVITRAQVAEVIHERTEIPVERAMGKESKELLQLEDTIHEQMVDQVEAVDAVAASLRRARAQLTEGKRPIANFLFLGPTGVGKTELAKTISRIYFGGEEYMVRIDMSEYQHADSVKKLIGSGKSDAGYLTDAVRRQPFALVLLDEFEKAHPQILNLFLQVMDDGRLTDGAGRTVDFTNTILIATSNAGAVYIQDQIRAGADVETIKNDLIETKLRDIMRPELLNRFDDVIVFKPLSMEDVQAITKLLLGGLAKNLERQGIALEVREGAVKKLAEEGFDPEFGARPLRRLIQDTVENQIASLLLAEKVRRRDTVILTDAGTVEVKKARRL